MTALIDLSLSQILAQLNAGTLTSVEITTAYLDSIAAQDEVLGAYLHVDREAALAAAQAADDARANGDTRPLLGVPMAIKDLITTEGVVTTAGSKILEGYTPIYDATVIRKLKDAGYVLIGKVNLDEFGMGGSNENSGFFPARNPWDTSRVPGGSSGGSGVAVAAGMAAGSLGTDTGGSVRLPAAWCGITALKPSYGRVSRYGLIAFGSSLDSIGPLAHTVEDVARLLQVIAGHDPLDSTSMPLDVPDYVAALEGGVAGLKIGIPQEYYGEGLTDEVRAAVEAAIEQMRALGAEIVDVSLPTTPYSLAVYYLLATSEASSNLARFDGVRFGPREDTGEMWDTYRETRALFGAEVKRRIMLGTYALSAGYYDAYYGKAQAVRTLIKREMDAVLADVDVLLTPVTPTAPFKMGEKASDPLQMYLADMLTVSASLAGVPALALPCGLDGNHLPIGMQIIGAQFKEDMVLRVGHAYQQATDWHTKRPPRQA
jgi:aspartyl-tRNA(Asn)/glutamyl-tRNA(Gln) amidotransferase subunit A